MVKAGGKPLLRPLKRIKPTLPGALTIQKSINVGVDISHDSLRLVKIKKVADDKRQLLDYQSIPLDPRIRRGTPEFISFLKTELTRFCGPYQRIDIWAIMSAASVTVRHIRIPKVAKSEIENVVFWSIKKETPFNEKENLLDFEVLEEVSEQGVPKLLVMAYTTPRREIEETKSLFSKAGMPLTGISIVPFAVQNIFRTGWMPAQEESVASLFIGNDFSRIDIYAKGNLIMTRGIKAGINSMVESLLEALSEQKQGAAEEATPAIRMEQARKVLFSLSPDSARLTERDAGYHLTEEDKFRIILPSLERLVRQIDRTFEHFKMNVDQARVNRIFISSAMNIYQPLIAYVGEQLGIESEVLNPLDRNLPGIDGTLQDDNLSERVTLTPALGMALSDRAYTPNLLFTFKDKEQLAKMKRASLAAFAVFALAAVLTAGFFIYELGLIGIKKADMNRLQKELAQFQPRVSQNDILQMAASAKQQKYSSRAYSERYRSMAVIGELSALTPANIRLVNMKADFVSVPVEKAKEKAKETPKAASALEKPEKKEAAKETAQEQAPAATMGSIVVEGVVLGSRQSLESSLADYITKLQTSPIFRQVTLQKNSVDRVNKRDVLRFTINMKIAAA